MMKKQSVGSCAVSRNVGNINQMVFVSEQNKMQNQQSGSEMPRLEITTHNTTTAKKSTGHTS
jgi:hypothetical protein